MSARLSTMRLSLCLWGNLLLGLLAQPVSAALPTSIQHWEQCATRYAQELNIDPALFQAMIWTESRNQPLAIAWTDRWGKRHSVYPDSHADARTLIAQLQRSKQEYDLGLGQVNSRNIARLAKPLEFQATDLLRPCTNLQVASHILGEQLDKHGHTWRAVAGYNGSTQYIELVWTNLCQRHTSPLCQSNGTSLRATRIPAPTDSLHPVTRSTTPALATLISTTPSSPVLTLQRESTTPEPGAGSTRSTSMAVETPETSKNWLDRLPTATTMLWISLRILAPFTLFIGTIVLLCYGIRIIFWSVGLVRDSLFSLLRGHPTSFPHPLHRPITS